MASDNETVAEIVTEMRTKNVDRDYDAIMRLYAHRIEVAHRCEVAELRECVSDMRSWFRLYYSCSGYHNRLQCAGCSLARCPYHKWRKALEGVKDEGK